MFNRFVPGLSVSSVSCDNVAGGELAAQTLVRSGGSRFALITGGADTTTNRDRVNGFERGLLAAGVDIGNFSRARATTPTTGGTARPDPSCRQRDVQTRYSARTTLWRLGRSTRRVT
jgi:DNA-binding LacI/PurR family transcriptional regulator